MEEWKEYKLGDVLSIKYGKDHKHLADGNIPIYGSGGIMRYGDSSLYSGPSILIPRKGSLNNIMYSDKPFWTVDTMFWTIINEEIANPLFVYYSICKKDFASLNVGSAVPSLTVPVIEDVDILLPSKQVQNKVVAILKSLDDKIEVNRRINENLEQQTQALFKSWFVDFEPFKYGEFVESELGMIPKGWRVKEAQDVFEINIGKTPPRKESEWFTESKEDNVWVSIADMGSCGVFISDSSEYLTDEAIKRFNVLMVEKDSVLLSFKLTVGRVAIADTRLTTNEAIARFILPDKCYREFLYLYLKQYKYENLGSTSSIATAVNSKTIKGMKLIVPPTDIIKSFSKNTKPLFEQIRVLQQESNRLATLRDTLLPKLMSGEINVLNAELINEMLSKRIR